MKIDRLIEVIDQNCWLLREAGELACDARAQHPRTSRLVAIQRRVKVVKSGKGPPWRTRATRASSGRQTLTRPR